jgi:parallel beta-helix repeat protein
MLGILCLAAPGTQDAAAQTPQTYHVSSVNPAASDTNPGTQAQPWRTLTRVQQAMPTLRAGDQVLFERGSTFNGSLTMRNVNGTADAPVIFGAYGMGSAPVISGLETLSGWVAAGANRWEATCSGCGARINHLLINGQSQALARYPNLDQGDEGYLYFDSASGRTSITDDALAGQNWAGGELVVRSIAWVLDRLRIQSHSGGTLTTASSASYDLTVGYGYFIQNHLNALDREGEWVYNPTTRKITLYRSSSPVTARVQVTTTDTLWLFDQVSNIQVRDLALHGGSEYTLDANLCTALKLERVQLLYGGAEAMRANSCTRLEIADSRLAHAMNFGLRLWACRDCLVHRSVIEDIATLAGMGKNGDGQYNGVQFDGVNSVFEYNTVRQIGYLGINFGGAVTIRNNLVSHFNRVKVDGGGIYGWHSVGGRILGNIVLYGDGSNAGIPWDSTATHGIYIDDNSENIEVRENTVGYMSASGIFLHNTRGVTVSNNTVFDVGEQGILLADDELGSYNVEQSLIENNRVFASDPGAVGIALSSNKGESFLGWLGTIRNNIYCTPTSDISASLTLVVNNNWNGQRYSLPQWQARSGHETGSSTCSARLPAFVERATLGGNQLANSTLATNVNGWVRWPENISSLTWDARMGGSLRFARTGGTDSIYAYHVIGAVSQGTLYRVRFRGVSEGTGTTVSLVFSRQGGDYGWIAQSINVVLTAAERDFTVYIRPHSAYANARLNFILSGSTPPIWLDNIEVVPVDAVPLTADYAARFEWNDSQQPRSITLGSQGYTDLRGQRYAPNSTFTLEPYQSIVLIRDMPEAAAALRGSIALQGRAPSAQPLSVELTGSTTATLNPFTNGSGIFILVDLALGSHTVRVKHAQSLSTTREVMLTSSGAEVDFGVLRMGDVNNDNAVTLTDFSLIAANYNRAAGQPGYDARADLNGDGVVSIQDFSLMASNYNQRGT